MRVTIYRKPPSCEVKIDLSVDEVKKIFSEALDKMAFDGSVTGIIVSID